MRLILLSIFSSWNVVHTTFLLSSSVCSALAYSVRLLLYTLYISWMDMLGDRTETWLWMGVDSAFSIGCGRRSRSQRSQMKNMKQLIIDTDRSELVSSTFPSLQRSFPAACTLTKHFGMQTPLSTARRNGISVGLLRLCKHSPTSPHP